MCRAISSIPGCFSHRIGNLARPYGREREFETVGRRKTRTQLVGDSFETVGGMEMVVIFFFFFFFKSLKINELKSELVL